MRYGLWKKGLVAGIIGFVIGASCLPSIAATDDQKNEIETEIEEGIQIEKMTSAPYTGRLRVYVVEPVSRWMMYNGEPYHFGFLGFAFNDAISINPQDTLQKSITWDGDVTETNVMVIAVVSNSEQHQEYVPPLSKPFKAFYTDATAAATPGNTGYNIVTTGFTHTVFVEEITATTCPYCPIMGEALYAIYESGDYPWYFAALVYDMNSQASNRRDEYNVYGIPLAFFDGGYQSLQGEQSTETVCRPLIEPCGTRKVPVLDLSVSVSYSGDGNLHIAIAITNKDGVSENQPPNTPTITGETNGATDLLYYYLLKTTDPDQDTVEYFLDWGDNTNSGWIGPYISGEEVSLPHSWNSEGTFHVKGKARDADGLESDWVTLTVTMPYSYNRPIPQFLDVLFQRFPNAFPLLHQIMGY